MGACAACGSSMHLCVCVCVRAWVYSASSSLWRPLSASISACVCASLTSVSFVSFPISVRLRESAPQHLECIQERVRRELKVVGPSVAVMAGTPANPKLIDFVIGAPQLAPVRRLRSLMPLRSRSGGRVAGLAQLSSALLRGLQGR